VTDKNVTEILIKLGCWKVVNIYKQSY